MSDTVPLWDWIREDLKKHREDENMTDYGNQGPHVSYIPPGTPQGVIRKKRLEAAARRTGQQIKNSTFVKNLKHQFEENPVAVLVAVAGILAAGAKLIDAWGHSKGSRAYAKQVNYRINKSR